MVAQICQSKHLRYLVTVRTTRLRIPSTKLQVQADCSRSELRLERPADPEAAGHWQLALSSHRLRRLPLNFRSLGNLQGIINLDAKVPDR